MEYPTTVIIFILVATTGLMVIGGSIEKFNRNKVLRIWENLDVMKDGIIYKREEIYFSINDDPTMSNKFTMNIFATTKDNNWFKLTIYPNPESSKNNVITEFIPLSLKEAKDWLYSLNRERYHEMHDKGLFEDKSAA